MRWILLLAFWLILGGCPAWCQAPQMPDVVGQDLDSAEAALRLAGVERWQVLRASTTRGVGRIIQQSPVPGTAVEERTYRPTLYLGVPHREPLKLDAIADESSAEPRESGFSWVLFLIVQGLVVAALWQGYRRFKST